MSGDRVSINKCKMCNLSRDDMLGNNPRFAKILTYVLEINLKSIQIKVSLKF